MPAPRGADPDQGGGEFPGRDRPVAQRAVVGQHLDQHRHRGVRGAGRRRPAEGAQQRGEGQQHEIVPFPQVSPLVREDRGELRLIQQVERAGADHDRRPQAGHAVGGRGRVVDHQRARYLGVAVREQGEQRPLPPAGPQHHGERRHQRPAQQQEQHDARGQRQQADSRRQSARTGGGHAPAGDEAARQGDGPPDHAGPLISAEPG